MTKDKNYKKRGSNQPAKTTKQKKQAKKEKKEKKDKEENPDVFNT